MYVNSYIKNFHIKALQHGQLICIFDLNEKHTIYLKSMWMKRTTKWCFGMTQS